MISITFGKYFATQSHIPMHARSQNHFLLFVALFNVESSILFHGMWYFFVSLSPSYFFFSLFSSHSSNWLQTQCLSPVVCYTIKKASRSRKVVCVNWLWNCHAPLFCVAMLYFALPWLRLFWFARQTKIHWIKLSSYSITVDWWIAKLFSVWSSFLCLNCCHHFSWKRKKAQQSASIEIANVLEHSINISGCSCSIFRSASDFQRRNTQASTRFSIGKKSINYRHFDVNS